MDKRETFTLAELEALATSIDGTGKEALGVGTDYFVGFNDGCASAVVAIRHLIDPDYKAPTFNTRGGQHGEETGSGKRKGKFQTKKEYPGYRGTNTEDARKDGDGK